MEYLKKRNVFVVGIGNGSSEEIKKACSEYVEIHAPNYILSFEMVSAFTGVNHGADIFFTSLVSNYYKNIDTSWKLAKIMRKMNQMNQKYQKMIKIKTILKQWGKLINALVFVRF